MGDDRMYAMAKAQAQANAAHMHQRNLANQIAEPARPVNVSTLLEKLETLRQDLVDLHSHANSVTEFLEPSPKSANGASVGEGATYGTCGSAGPVDIARDLVASCASLVGRVNERLFEIERRIS